VASASPVAEIELPAEVHRTVRERWIRRVLRGWFAVLVLMLIAYLAASAWARHEFTQVESVVALHSSMLEAGSGLYFGLNRYPYTVSPYGPLFYGASALLHRAGLPVFQGARAISFAALLVSLCLVWRALGLLVADSAARFTGLLIAGLTANLLFWGTVGQVDILACCLSLAAFVQFLEWRERPRGRRLFACGLFVLLAVFTKQTAVAGGLAIGISLLWRNRGQAVWWIVGVAATGIACAAALDALTGGHYFDDAFRSNLNPFSAAKLAGQAQYMTLASGGVLALVAAGMRRPAARLAPLYIYSGLALAVWLATAPKIGSDLNYQLELNLLLAIGSGCALDRLGFFPACFAGKRTWVTLLQIPLAFHLVLNTSLIARTLAARMFAEPLQRAESAALAPFLEAARGPVLAVSLDALVHARGRIDVEPLIYTLLVEAGVTDPEPVRRDLAARRFGAVVLYENLFAANSFRKNSETPSLPAAQLEEIRKNYRLVRHTEGPYLEGDYVYEPRRD
jgi:hypothetical protein